MERQEQEEAPHLCLSDKASASLVGVGTLAVVAIAPAAVPLTILSFTGAWAIRYFKKQQNEERRQEILKQKKEKSQKKAIQEGSNMSMLNDEDRRTMLHSLYPSVYPSYRPVYSQPSSESILAGSSPELAHDILTQMTRAKVFTQGMSELSGAAQELARQPGTTRVQFFQGKRRRGFFGPVDDVVGVESE